MKIKEIVSALERFAPLPLQDGFDNAGLQIGLTEAEATGALLCLDVTEAILDEAIALGYNLVISHHPLIFKGYKSITGKDYVERCMLKAIKNDIVIYSAHTNLDNAYGGVNYKIAEKKRTNKWLAEQLGKDPATISKWCTNNAQPNLENLVEIAKCLGVTVNDLIR